MEYTAEYDNKNQLCTIRVTGKHKRPEGSLILQNFVLECSEKNNCNRFFIDYTQAQIISSTFDSYEAGTMPVDKDKKMMGIKIALLFVGDMDDHKFMESVAYNRGYLVRVFDDRDEAMAWLLP